jgi:hypothetical protein
LSDSRSSSPRGRDGTSSERRTSRRRRLRLKRRASPGGTLRLYARGVRGRRHITTFCRGREMLVILGTS